VAQCDRITKDDMVLNHPGRAVVDAGSFKGKIAAVVSLFASLTGKGHDARRGLQVLSGVSESQVNRSKYGPSSEGKPCRLQG
jgi:hypothetical protein